MPAFRYEAVDAAGIRAGDDAEIGIAARRQRGFQLQFHLRQGNNFFAVQMAAAFGRDLVFDEGDAVAQLQLAFFQPLQPQQIRRRRLMQRIDRRIEIAMLLL